MDAAIDWFTARAVVFGALAILVYVMIPPKRMRKGGRHVWKK